MKKNIILHLCIFIVIYIIISFFSINVKTVYAEDESSFTIEGTVEDLIDDLDLSVLQEMLDEYLGDGAIKEVLLQALKGEYLSFDKLTELFLFILKNNVRPLLKTFISIFGIILICSLISSLKSEKSELSDIIFIVCYCGVALIAFSQCSAIIKELGKVIVSLCKQIDGIFPILITFISFTGSNASAAFFKPTSAFLSKLASSLTQKILFPIIGISLVLAVTSSLSEKYTLKKTLDFFISLYKWIIGLVVISFSVFSVVKGVSASIYDSLSLRTLKYAIGNTFPLIGGFAKEGVDVVIASGILIKNGIGVVAIILLLFALISPFVKIAMLSLSFKFISAVIEPLADARITQLFSGLSKVITMLATLLLTVFIIYGINFLLVIISQNGLIG